jgi:hypothetical protein
MDLVYHYYTSVVRPLDEVARITPGQGYDGRLGLQGQGEGFFVQREQQVIHSEGLAGTLPDCRQLPCDIIDSPIGASQTPQPTGI